MNMKNEKVTIKEDDLMERIRNEVLKQEKKH